MDELGKRMAALHKMVCSPAEAWEGRHRERKRNKHEGAAPEAGKVSA